ncbi:hypothetical protein BDZ45DRAFT_807034 [Acephala macrosclerotiorum]|nr:hypothetical protein BDZ45DRAFT_807034 [Acephala macrosclerotiorum]
MLILLLVDTPLLLISPTILHLGLFKGGDSSSVKGVDTSTAAKGTSTALSVDTIPASAAPITLITQVASISTGSRTSLSPPTSPRTTVIITTVTATGDASTATGGGSVATE